MKKSGKHGEAQIIVETDPELERMRDCNARFYQALERASLEEMEAVWSKEDPTTCVHVGTRLFPGTETILKTWGHLFEQFSAFRVEPTEMVVTISGPYGMIITIERYLDVEMRDEGEEEGEEEVDGDEPLDEDEDTEEDEEDVDEDEDEDDEDEDEEEDEEEDEGEDDEDGERLLVATHAFRRDEDGWKLAHRHTSSFKDDGDFFLTLETLKKMQARQN